MSGRMLAAGMRMRPTGRRATSQAVRHLHRFPTGGLLRTDASIRATRMRMWFGGNSFHNAVTVRNASFGRFLPKLVVKFARIPALFGGMTVAGLAWIQYQANQAGTYAIHIFNSTTDAVSSTLSSLFDGAADVAEQTRQGWEATRDQTEIPDWLKKVLRIHEEIGTGGSGPGGDGDPKHSKAGALAAGGASAAAYGSEAEEDDDAQDQNKAVRDDQMVTLTKNMIEVRTILKKVGQSDSLSLPSIVVVGSQSSGKSSVLEAIVGHEFLPKGSNMVTRRPIELTLVNTPADREEYGDFPDLGLRRITDFSSIQRTLTELNLAVPDSDCVSDDPIHLTIYSPNVPDLSLIDLPGYIQIAGRDQPTQLEQKITELCEKYIQPPNVILAISAANTDLANSTALRASQRVDPRGQRTIGVITKMDLVDPSLGTEILSNNQYPLRLGYVGVVCKAPASRGLFKMGHRNLLSTIAQQENAYFSSHPLEFGPESGVNVGTTTLRQKLKHVLEQTMSSSLQSASDAVKQELDDVRYEFKVQYNERPLSAESYLAESLDAFKHSFKQFAEEFGRPEMYNLLKSELDQKILDLLAARYWNKPISYLSKARPEPENIADLPKADPESLHWHRQLDASTADLMKLGVGRLGTSVVSSAIQTHVEKLVERSTFAAHPLARNAIMEATSTILNDRYYTTCGEVENSIKPYKFEMDVEKREWAQGREHVQGVLKNELKACESALTDLETDMGGRRKLKEVTNFIDKVRKGGIVVEGEGHSGAGGFSAELLRRGREAVFLRDRADIIRMRMMAAKSKQCANFQNKYYCPEIFLDAAASKLAATSVLFLNVELLSEFYSKFPRELDRRLGRHLSEAEVEKFAKENPDIRHHLELTQKKDLLELALGKMESLGPPEAGGGAGGVTHGKMEQGRWRLF